MFITQTNSTESGRNIKKQTVVFLIITFAITYISNFIMLGKYGSITDSISNGSAPVWQFILSIQMLYPAVSAIICLLIFRDSGLNKISKLFLGYFMLFFIISIISIFYNPEIVLPSSSISPAEAVNVKLFDILTLIFGIAGVIFFAALNTKKDWREELKPLKLSFGRKGIFYLIIPGAYVLLFTISYYLNGIFGFGLPAVTFSISTFFIILVAGLFNGILRSWMFFFGEEFGWRVYLQDRLTSLFGSVKGVLLIGVIWGVWHAPIIAMGYNYPGHPVLGVIAMILFTVVTGIFMSYAVFMTKSVWIAALLHLLTNTLAPCAMMYISNPSNPVFSFGMGIYGIVFMGIAAAVILLSRSLRKEAE